MQRNSTALGALGALLCGGLVAAAVPAYAAELVTAELVGTQNVVEVEQGKSADFTITLSATGNAACGSTSTAKVKHAFTLSDTGAISTGSGFSAAVNFSAPGTAKGNCDIVRSGDGVRSASVSAASTTALGDYKILLGEKSGTTEVTNSNTSGGKLEDTTATTVTFKVVAPVVVNQAPASGNTPDNASGEEGSALQTSGSFTDADGDLASIMVTSGEGVVTAHKDTSGALTGSWSWSLPTADNVSGSVTVTATDSHNATATQSFSYAAANAAPRIAASAGGAHGLEGGTLRTSGAFTDVSGDVPLAITKLSGDGDVLAKADGTWSWSLATTNETSGTVQVQADDGDRGVTVDTFTFTADNVAPGVRTDAQDVEGDEGSMLGNAGAFSDVPADTLTVSHTGDGTFTQTSDDGAWLWSVVGADNATGQISVTASDGTATSTPDTFTYTILNVAPAVAVAANNASGDEGTTLTTSGRFSDVSTDPLTITVLSGPGEVLGNSDGTWSWSFAGTDDLTEQVVVQADDGDGGKTTDTFNVRVDNLAPTVLVSAQPATGSEGNTLATSGAFTDVPADTITITSDGGVLLDKGDGTWSWSLATTDQTSGTVIVTATDDNGDTVTDTFTYEASNVAPQVTVEAVNQNGAEGDTLIASGSFQDVAADNITVSQTSGPGTVTDLGSGKWTYTLTTTDQITATVEVTATDKDGASTSDEFTVTAINVAPAVGTAPANSSGSEGGTLTTSGSFTDVPADPITLTKTGDGTLVDNRDGTWSWSLATTDDASGSVTVTADDGDGGKTTSTFTYAAGNVAPTISALSVTGITGAACTTGNAVGLKFTVTDPGSADTMTGTINWGDGSSSEAFTSRSVHTSHAYAAGSYTITVNVSDDDGGAAAPQSALVVLNYALGAIQTPFNVDGTSVFKYGSTVPVKVRITDCAGAPVPGLAPTIKVALASSATPSTAINETVDSTSAADTTGVLRYDATAGHYIYNMATKSLPDGDGKYVVTVANGGTQVTQKFGLRTK